MKWYLRHLSLLSTQCRLGCYWFLMIFFFGLTFVVMFTKKEIKPFLGPHVSMVLGDKLNPRLLFSFLFIFYLLFVFFLHWSVSCFWHTGLHYIVKGSFSLGVDGANEKNILISSQSVVHKEFDLFLYRLTWTQLRWAIWTGSFYFGRVMLDSQKPM